MLLKRYESPPMNGFNPPGATFSLLSAQLHHIPLLPHFLHRSNTESKFKHSPKSLGTLKEYIIHHYYLNLVFNNENTEEIYFL